MQGFLIKFVLYRLKIIVIKKLDCFRLIAFAMTWRETTGGRHCEVQFLRFTSILVVLTTNLEVYCKTKQSSLLITSFILLKLSRTVVPVERE